MNVASPSVPPIPSADDALALWRAQIATLPARHPRRIGELLLGAGAALMLAGVPASLGLMNAGFWTALAGALLARPPLHRTPAFAAGLACAIWIGIACVATIALGRHGDPLRGHFGELYTWLAFPLALAAFAEARWRRLALRLLLVALAASLALALVQYLVGWDKTARPLRIGAPPQGVRMKHASGFLGYHLTYGVACTLVLVALAGGIAQELGRVGAWAGRVAALAGLLLTSARLAILGAAAGLAVRLMAVGRLRHALLGAGVALLLIGGGAAIVRVAAPEKFADLVSLRDGRFAIWRTTATWVVEHPLVGSGGRKALQEGYAARWARVHAEGEPEIVERQQAHAHNSFLGLASEHGLPALAFHLAWLGCILRHAWRRRREQPEGWRTTAGLLAVWMVSGQLNVLTGQSEYMFAFGGLLGLALARRAGA